MFRASRSANRRVSTDDSSGHKYSVGGDSARAGTVLRWLGSQSVASVFVSAVTEAELRYGVQLLPRAKRHDALAAQIIGMIEADFAGRILPFDSSAAIAYAAVVTGRLKAGRPMGQADAQIAAIARSRGAQLATRNEADVDGCGVEIMNPWRDIS